MNQIRLGAIQKKMLILLMGGLSIGLSHSPRQQFQILKQMGKEWDKINQRALKRAIRSLYERKLIDLKENKDGSISLLLNDNGKQKVLNYKLENIKIKIPPKWDQKWRLIIFDIPEKFKKVREAIRDHLKRFGFYQLQKSVFVSPYECQNEIEFLIEFYNIRPYVRQIIAEKIDNELHLKQIFKLNS
jgi:CRISPR-associated endonuclease Cas2